MPATDSAAPPARYGFALRHAYGVAVLAIAFVSTLVTSDLVATYGETGARYPYALALPFTGLVLTLALGIWLAIIAGGDIESPTAQSFLPLYAVGAGVWLVITAAIAAVLAEPTTAAACLLAVAAIAAATRHSGTALARPRDVTPGTLPWPGAVMLANLAAIAAVGALYTGALPVSSTLPVLVGYAATTVAFPFALFVDAYRHAARRGRTWRFGAVAGCLGVAGLVTLGTTNWLLAPLYAIIRVASTVERK